eukprot:g62771.t1
MSRTPVTSKKPVSLSCMINSLAVATTSTKFPLSVVIAVCFVDMTSVLVVNAMENQYQFHFIHAVVDVHPPLELHIMDDCKGLNS